MVAGPSPLPPLHAAILIGGASTRMGAPKQLIARDGRSWLDSTVSIVSPFASRLVVVGAGLVPATQQRLPRVDDVLDVGGPLAGILAALRSDRGAAWLVVACDLPRLHVAALTWLIEQRCAGAAGVIPILADGRPQPLLAIYEPVAADAVESLARQGRFAPRELAGCGGFLTPVPPAALEVAWTNVNTPEELAALDP